MAQSDSDLLNPGSIGRRRFGQTMSAMVAGTVLSEPTVANQQTCSNPVSDADLYLQIIQVRCGERLNEEQLIELRKKVTANLERSKQLSVFPLTNGDEPAPHFQAYRSDV